MATAGSQLHSIQADLSESEYEDMQTCRVTRNSSHCSSNSRSIAGTNRTVVPITYKCTTRLRKHRLERDFASNFDVGSSGCKSSSPQSLINDRKVYILKESHCLKDEMADLRTQIKQTQDYLGHYMKELSSSMELLSLEVSQLRKELLVVQMTGTALRHTQFQPPPYPREPSTIPSATGRPKLRESLC